MSPGITCTVQVEEAVREAYEELCSPNITTCDILGAVINHYLQTLIVVACLSF